MTIPTSASRLILSFMLLISISATAQFHPRMSYFKYTHNDSIFMIKLSNGFTIDHSNAANYYQNPDISTDPEGSYILGCMYHLGAFVKQDDALAKEYFIRAADLSYNDAMLAVGKNPSLPDSVRSKYLTKAADEGDVEAMFALGHSLYSLPVDVRAAWLQKAHENGHSTAASDLAQLLRDKKDDPEGALKWFLISDSPFDFRCAAQLVLYHKKDSMAAFNYYNKAAYMECPPDTKHTDLFKSCQIDAIRPGEVLSKRNRH